jgi:predicted chitinase
MPEPAELITIDRLKAICPRAEGDILEAIVTAAPSALPAAGLDDPIHIAHFIAQIAAETGGLRRLDEDLFYTTTTQLHKIFPSKFRSLDAAKPYLRDPEKLANFVYKGRIGNKEPGDGWLYRGSGLIQLTGRANFAKVGKLVGMDLEGHPELARHADSALQVALGYWTKNNINRVAGAAGVDTVKAVTRLINPALAGLADREAYFKKAIKVLAPPGAPAPSVGKEAAKAEPRKAKAKPMGLAAREPAPAPAAPPSPAVAPPTAPELSGPQWTSRFPTSRDIADLEPDFARDVTGFIDALKAAGAHVDISATYRPKERAYLMHWCWLVAKRQANPAQVPPMKGVAILWDHGSLPKSCAAAQKMVDAYGMAFVAALNSRHTERRAVDMTISWSGPLPIKQKDGSTVKITTQPRNGSNRQLVAVGAGYGVIKLITDPPHWSDDGR